MQLNFWLYIRKQERYKCSTSKSNLHAIYLTKCTTWLLGSRKCYTNISKTIRLEMGTQCKSPSVSKSLNAGSHLPTLCICRDNQITHCYFILVLEKLRGREKNAGHSEELNHSVCTNSILDSLRTPFGPHLS